MRLMMISLFSLVLLCLVSCNDSQAPYEPKKTITLQQFKILYKLAKQKQDEFVKACWQEY